MLAMCTRIVTSVDELVAALKRHDPVFEALAAATDRVPPDSFFNCP
jgi:hypothetical protein